MLVVWGQSIYYYVGGWTLGEVCSNEELSPGAEVLIEGCSPCSMREV